MRIQVSDDHYKEEKELMAEEDSFTTVGDSPTTDDNRRPLDGLEAMAFAQEYIKQLNETNPL